MAKRTTNMAPIDDTDVIPHLALTHGQAVWLMGMIVRRTQVLPPIRRHGPRRASVR